MKLFATLLFIVLSPGLLLTLPPIAGKWYMTGKTSIAAILVHAVVFYTLLMFKESIPILRDIEGFQGEQKPESTKCDGPGCACMTYTQCASNQCVNRVCK